MLGAVALAPPVTPKFTPSPTDSAPVRVTPAALVLPVGRAKLKRAAPPTVPAASVVRLFRAKAEPMAPPKVSLPDVFTVKLCPVDVDALSTVESNWTAPPPVSASVVSLPVVWLRTTGPP